MNKLAMGALVLVMGLLVVTNPMVVDAAGQITGADIKDKSVTGTDVKDKSLTGKDVKNGSLKKSDLATGTITDQRPMFGVFRADSSVVRTRGMTMKAFDLVGGYTLKFTKSVSACAATATISSGDSTLYAGYATLVRYAADEIFVQTWDGSGTNAALPFNIIVTC